MVTVEETNENNEVTKDYTGSILGVVVSIDDGPFGGRIVNTQWTANTSYMKEWQLPNNAVTQRYAYPGTYVRFKVISRKVNWVKE